MKIILPLNVKINKILIVQLSVPNERPIPQINIITVRKMEEMGNNKVDRWRGALSRERLIPVMMKLNQKCFRKKMGMAKFHRRIKLLICRN